MRGIALTADKEADFIAILRDLFELGCFNDVLNAGVQGLDTYPKNVKLWRLLGCACGALGLGHDARECFFTALMIDPFDKITLANLITSYFHDNDPALGVRAIQEFYPTMNNDARQMVIGALVEALRIGLVDIDDLPKETRVLVDGIFFLPN